MYEKYDNEFNWNSVADGGKYGGGFKSNKKGNNSSVNKSNKNNAVNNNNSSINNVSTINENISVFAYEPPLLSQLISHKRKRKDNKK